MPQPFQNTDQSNFRHHVNHTILSIRRIGNKYSMNILFVSVIDSAQMPNVVQQHLPQQPNTLTYSDALKLPSQVCIFSKNDELLTAFHIE